MQANLQPITADEQALEELEDYTGNYYSIAICQYKLSRRTKSIKDSLVDAHEKVGDVCSKVIRQRE